MVYPRVGGGTMRKFPAAMCHPGLSPRGRGNQNEIDLDTDTFGSIPAWAGEPEIAKDGDVTVKVYPRVGGGTYSD